MAVRGISSKVASENQVRHKGVGILPSGCRRHLAQDRTSAVIEGKLTSAHLKHQVAVGSEDMVLGAVRVDNPRETFPFDGGVAKVHLLVHVIKALERPADVHVGMELRGVAQE